MQVVLGILSALLAYITVRWKGSPNTCAELESTLGPSIVKSSGDVYEASVSGVWNLFNTQYQPSCIVYPRNESHVQTAMRAIYRDKIHYSVQAGGHSGPRGWNSVQNGVLIHFAHMTGVSYDSAKDTITLQPGVRWGDVVSTLEPLGVAAPGGRLVDVGTGLLLGGGLSFLSSEHGFSADSFKEVDVVLVNGDLVTASATNEYADLFRALKGGANRFGIVTRYELYPVHTGTREDKRWFGGLIIYPESSAEDLLVAVSHYVRDVKDPKAALMVALVNNIKEGVLSTSHVVSAFYRGSKLPREIFGEFLAIPSTVDFLGPQSYYHMANALAKGNDRGSGQLFGASAFRGGKKQYLDAFKQWTNFTTTFKDEITSTVLAFTPVLGPQIAAGKARGGNAISPPNIGYAAVQFQTTFPLGLVNISDAVDSGRQLVLERIPRSPGLPLYVGECDAGQNVFETYGDYEFLKRTYAKYDPTRFNMNYTDGPMGL